MSSNDLTPEEALALFREDPETELMVKPYGGNVYIDDDGEEWDTTDYYSGFYLNDIQGHYEEPVTDEQILERLREFTSIQIWY